MVPLTTVEIKRLLPVTMVETKNMLTVKTVESKLTKKMDPLAPRERIEKHFFAHRSTRMRPEGTLC